MGQTTDSCSIILNFKAIIDIEEDSIHAKVRARSQM
jgi:hypothetical protein